MKLGLRLCLCAIALGPWLASASPVQAAANRRRTSHSSPELRAQRAATEARLRNGPQPPSGAELRALGPRAEEATAAIAEDAHADVHLRERALAALANLPSAATQGFLGQMIAARKASTGVEERLLLRQAALALGWQGGPAAPPVLGPLLAHADADVRIDAALALGLTRQAGAVTWLRGRLAEETDARVRGQIGRQLRVVEGALGAGATAAAVVPDAGARR